MISFAIILFASGWVVIQVARRGRNLTVWLLVCFLGFPLCIYLSKCMLGAGGAYTGDMTPLHSFLLRNTHLWDRQINVIEDFVYAIVGVGAGLVPLAACIKSFYGAQDEADAMLLQICQTQGWEPQFLNSNPPVADVRRLLVGAWRDEEGETTFCADGTETSKFDTGTAESGRWSMDGYVITIIITKRDGKAIDSVSLQYIVKEIDNSTFCLKQIGNSECEWRASRILLNKP